MASSTYFFVVASAWKRLRADYTKDIQVAMFNLKQYPLELQKETTLYDRLLIVEEYSTVKQAQSRLKKFVRMSLRKKLELVESINPDWIDLSEKWFPVASVTSTIDFGQEYFGDTSGGIGAKLMPRVPPRAASEAVDPVSILNWEEQVRSGYSSSLLVGA